MEPIQLAIISRGRAATQPTLKWLLSEDCDFDIRLFLHSSDPQVNDYSRWTKHVKEIVVHDGANGAAARNAVLDHYDEGTHVVTFDDDIPTLLYLSKKDGKLHPYEKEKLLRLMENAEGRMGLHRTKAWGIYPVDNAFYMSTKTVFGFYFLRGGVFGTITDDSLRFDEGMWFKADYDYSLQVATRFGGVVRYNGTAMKEQRIEGGAIQQRTERPGSNEEAIQILLKRWPKYVKRNPRRDGEILIRRRT